MSAPETLIAVGIGGVVVAIVAAAALGLLGMHVVKKHPAAYDPARSAKRYTRPALFLFILSCLGVLAFVVCIVTAGFIILAAP